MLEELGARQHDGAREATRTTGRKGEDGKPLPYLDGVDVRDHPGRRHADPEAAGRRARRRRVHPLRPRRRAEGRPDGSTWSCSPRPGSSTCNFNVRPQLNGKDNPLANAKVRQAMNYADRQERDHPDRRPTNVGTPMDSYMSAATPLHHGERPALSLRCREGQGAAEGGRVRRTASRSSCSCSPAMPTRSAIAAALQQMWAPIGVKLDAAAGRQRHPHRALPRGRLPDAARRLDRRHRRPERDHLLLRLSPTIDALHSGWKNEEADKLFEQSQKETDPAKRAEQYEADPGDLHRRRRRSLFTLRDALSGGAAARR